MAAARSGPLGDLDLLVERVCTLLGLDPDDEEGDDGLVDDVLDRMLEDDGPLALLAGDVVVHVPTITEGIVLTHRMNSSELALGVLVASFDLAGFRRIDDLRLADGTEIEPFSADTGHLAWAGPEGWLASLADGDVVAVRVDSDGRVSLDRLEADPDVDGEVAGLLRAVYDTEVAEPWLPVRGHDLVLGMLARDPAVFADARPPLEELAAAAGLERRLDSVAHEASVWRNQERLRRAIRLHDRLCNDAEVAAAARALDAADDVDAGEPVLRQALGDLAQDHVLSEVAAALLDAGGDDAADAVQAFAERLATVATKPTERAVAQWLAAVAAERRGEPLVAEQHLQVAVEADPDWYPGVDRLAWYVSDRGNALGAVRLWRSLGVHQKSDPDLATVLPFVEPGGPKLGRNEPCWCGSGRKFKQCHLGQVRPVPLADRVDWLARKAVAYLERQGAQVEDDVVALAEARASDPHDPDAVEAAMGEPLVVDLVLHELGWFERFLAERGPLLPDDERLLAMSWALVDRSVFEVTEVRPGEGLSVRDLGTGDVLEVRERTFSCQARTGMLVCARAVPDSATHQFVGGLFEVPPGREAVVLDLLDHGEPEDLLAWVAALERPPRLETREGEPLVHCHATLVVADPAAARGFLDETYDVEGEAWVELHDIGEDESVLRATLHLDGTKVTVETMSERRVERVIEGLRTGLPGTRVTEDDRQPHRFGDPPPVGLPAPGAVPVVDPVALAQLQETLERRWLAEPVPALAGLTPRQAAEDPTRRPELERLIASFPTLPRPGAGADGFFTMRPDRLRAALGLDDG